MAWLAVERPLGSAAPAVLPVGEAAKPHGLICPWQLIAMRRDGW